MVGHNLAFRRGILTSIAIKIVTITITIYFHKRSLSRVPFKSCYPQASVYLLNYNLHYHLQTLHFLETSTDANMNGVSTTTPTPISIKNGPPKVITHMATPDRIAIR